MQIIIAGHIPKQYTIEEIESDIKTIHSQTRVNLSDTEDGEDLIPINCVLELEENQQTPEFIFQLLQQLNSQEHIVWKDELCSESVKILLDSIIDGNTQGIELYFGKHINLNSDQHVQRITRIKNNSSFKIHTLD